MAARTCVCVQGEDGDSAAASEEEVLCTPAKKAKRYVRCMFKYNTWEFVLCQNFVCLFFTRKSSYAFSVSWPLQFCPSNAKNRRFYGFFHDIGLHKAMSFTRWRYGGVVGNAFRLK